MLLMRSVGLCEDKLSRNACPCIFGDARLRITAGSMRSRVRGLVLQPVIGVGRSRLLFSACESQARLLTCWKHIYIHL